MNYFLETLKESTKRITCDFDATKQIWHNASVGMLREKVIRDILKPYLPDCYGISGGLCYDSENNRSRQLDLILYDKLFSYRLPFEDNFMVFPCESVFGNIEVKTELNKETIQESIDNIYSLKSLIRKDATEFDVTPHLELRVNNMNLGSKKNDYFGAVFAYRSSNVETILKNINECDKSKNSLMLPDLFVLLDKQTIIYKADLKTKAIQLLGDTKGYVSIFTGEDTIAYFIITVLTVLYNSNLKSINPGNIFCSDIIQSDNIFADWANYVSL